MKSKPTAILTADIHLRDTQPSCRTDDFMEAMGCKIAWLKEIQKDHECPIIDAGDLFNSWKPSPYLLAWAISSLPKLITIPGNHDLPSHNIDLLYKSGLWVMKVAGVADVLLSTARVLEEQELVIHPFPYGAELKPMGRRGSRNFFHIALAHVMTYDGKSPWPGCKDKGAETILDEMAGYDLILTGHNHEPFVVEKGGRFLVNPGSLFRTSADQEQHRPRVYLWWAKERRVEPLFAPIERGVVSREHVDQAKRKNERLEAFVKSLREDMEVELSFRANLDEYFGKHRVRKGVKDMIEEAMDNE